MCSRSSLNHVYRTVWNRALGAMVAVAETTSSHGGGGSASVASAGGSYGIATPLALTLAVALAWGGGTTNAWANPTGGVAIVGSATMTTNGNNLTVTTQNGAGNYSAINWQSFSIPAGSSTYFQQPSATSTSINRVVTNTPSLIFGTLGSNGNLVLINQSGVTVGAGAVVDTADFTASALRMSDADALAGRMRFGDGSGGGAVSVQGSILARSGDVVLLAANIDTSKDALIQAPNGNTILAAGQQIEITGRGLEGIKLQVQAPTDSVVNLGTLKGDAVGIFASTLKHSGAIQANAVTVEGGKVVLKAVNQLEIDGTVQAQALGQKGGSIQASATNVKLDSTALLDASGNLGGGEVLVGGGFHGEDSRVANAQTTDVAAGAQLKADAVTSGDGGTVVVWSDVATRYLGSLSARGGALGGNGGQAEVSGKQYLDFRGLADLTAANGTKGTLLLDPLNITIWGSSDNFDGSGYGAITDLSNASMYPSVTSYVNTTTLGNLLATADVTLAASNDINVQSSISTSGNSTAATTLTLNAGHDLNFGGAGAPTIGSTAYALNVVLKAGTIDNTGGIATSGYGATINSQGGSITLTAGSGGIANAAQSPINLNSSGLGAAGNINLSSTGVVNTGSISANGSSSSSSSTPDGYAGGAITISAGSMVTTGTITALGGSGYGASTSNGGSGGSLTVTASSANVGSVDVSGGSGAYGGTVGGSGNVSMSTTGAGGITVGAVSTTGGNIVLTANDSASGISTGDLYADNSGSVQLTAGTGGIAAGNVDAYGAGSVTMSTTGDIQAARINGGSSGSVSLTATGNVFAATYGATIYGNGGNISIVAGGNIGYGTTLDSTGNSGNGNITLTSGADVSLSNVYAGGTSGNNSSSTSGGAVTIHAAGQVTAGSIDVSGGQPQNSTASNGGSVDIVAGTYVSTGSIYAYGGYGGYYSANGGNGGSVHITAGNDVSTGTIDVSGGQGGQYGFNGGNGGTVVITAGGIVTTSSIYAGGGYGSNYVGSGSNGGNGGGVIVVGADTTSLGNVDVSGGVPGYSSTGSTGAGGGVSLTLTTGDLSYGNNLYVNGASSLALVAQTGGISQASDISAGALITSSSTGTTLNGANQVSAFYGAVNGTGDLAFTNTGVLSVLGMTTANGNIALDNTGAVTTVGAVKAQGSGKGLVGITAHSPITIGTAGISATGNVSLSAATADSSSNIVINGAIQSSGGSVSVSAYNNIQQNSYVYGAAGVSASSTSGAITFGPNGYSGGSPLSYADANGSVIAPLVPLSALTTTGSTVSDFLDQFLAAVDQQKTFSDDPFDPRNRSKDALVVEGQVCTP